MLARLLTATLLPLADGLRTATDSGRQAAQGAADYWPEPRGRPGSYSVSAWTAPRNLTQKTLAWSWHNGGPQGKYSSAAHSGLVIDGMKNLYLSSTDGIRKLSSEGKLVWFSPMPTWRIPSLSDGKVYVTDNSGTLRALSMESGETLWSSKYTKALGTDISGVAVCDGVVLVESAGNSTGGATKVAGLDAQDGRQLWEFTTSAVLWNFMPMDTGNGTFIFQDRTGGVYHLRTRDGVRLWHSAYPGSSSVDFTDGLAMVSDGVVYAVHSDGKCCKAFQTSSLRASDLATGRTIWQRDFPYPANTQPVVAHLGQGTGLSQRLAVVIPIGSQPLGGKMYPSAIRALDAKTGEAMWEWAPPVWQGGFVAGDFNRLLHGTLCLPNPYGSASVDARGTVYVGHFNGNVYAIRDDNGDGAIQDSEVSAFDTGAGFSHGGVALAPGMLAIPSCDGVFVFREQ